MIKEKFKTLTSQVKDQETSADGTTTKLLIQLQGGQSVEAVIMRHDAGAGKYAGGPRQGGSRATLCVSSQVGCQMGCTFCATGTMGLKGNLSAGEIVEQLVHASQVTPIRNIVFMGMGEPLNNYKSVVEGIQIMTGRCFGLSPSHITVSTVGVIPRILSIANDLPGVNLALSLHAPTQELRCQIVPTAKAYPLHKLMAALNSYQTISRRRVLVEYVMLAGINDSDEVAHQLGTLLKDHNVTLNLIPYNPATSSDYKPTSQEDLTRFQKILRGVHGVRTTIRQEMGQDIAGACGQLVISQSVKQSPKLTDIEDMCSS
nr:uncharacterized protein LOC112290851 isoform X2 [Physcomitrium patens]XP_024393401.1 uncharacterized protein LOC112290851 isoform X2 [Physcomitrium patens]|eukprot:XP_024393400.1 uncharacterized protein LOC112290851 isoform X2 [Physcomitrella patens]